MTSPIKIISKQEYEKENPKPEQEEVWDSIAAPWKTYVVKEIPIVKEFLENKKGKIVDLGCGTCRNMIPNENIEYYGVDFSEGQLLHAKNYIKKEKINAHLIKSKIDKLDFENEFFDYGLFIASLHCLENKKEREDALKEFYRILKKDAEALISVWDSNDKRFRGLRGDIYMSWLEDGKPYMRYYYLYSKDEFLNLLQLVGFKVLYIYEPRLHDRFSKKNLIIRIKK